jgi:glyoxylase-like metal-dependent hydrolase (beta-lactamase superfamily II)
VLGIERFVCGPLANNVYLVVSAETRQCAVVDPGMDAEVVLNLIGERGLEVVYILNTHAHFDHTFSNAAFSQATGAPLALHPADLPLLERLVESATGWGFSGGMPSPEPQIELAHGQRLELAGEMLEVRHTPGHSPGQVAFIFQGNALVGDTLFWRGVGRWDLPGADLAQLEHSIRRQLFSLPDETVVWPGHGEQTTIGEEKRFNPYFGDDARFAPKTS